MTPALLVAVLHSVALSLAPGGQGRAVTVTPGPPQPTRWIAFSAELRIEHPDRPTAFGRFLQDEHGCQRRETVHPDGSLIVTILNFENATFYQLMRGTWASSPMRLAPGFPRQHVRALDRRVPPVEGYEAYLSVTETQGPRGMVRIESVLLPGLNYFEAVSKPGNGETITAQNILRGTPEHSEFLPPAGAAVTLREGFGGALVFQSLSLRVTFLTTGKTTRVDTGEEKPTPLRTPAGDEVFIVARALEHRTDVLYVRIMRTAKMRGPGRVEGEIIEEFEFPFHEAGTTTRLVENVTLQLTRIGARQIR